MSPHSKEPETEAGKKARQTYLQIACRVTGEPKLDYATLYKRFAHNDWAAIKLDDSVALAALQAGHSVANTFKCLLQGPYVQCQIHEKQVAVSGMGRYAESTVRKALEQVRTKKAKQKSMPLAQEKENQVKSEMER